MIKIAMMMIEEVLDLKDDDGDEIQMTSTSRTRGAEGGKVETSFIEGDIPSLTILENNNKMKLGLESKVNIEMLKLINLLLLLMIMIKL